MSRLIRNRKRNFIPVTTTPGMMFLCEIPKNKIFTYSTGLRAYTATGLKREKEFEAICVGSASWNGDALGKKVWLKKSTFKKARAIGDKLWPSDIRMLQMRNAHEEEYYIKPERFHKWLCAADLKRAKPHNFRWGYVFNRYNTAIEASEDCKKKFKQQGFLVRPEFRRG